MSRQRVAKDDKPRCNICGLRVERVPDSSLPDSGRLSHLGTVAGREAEKDHRPKMRQS